MKKPFIFLIPIFLILLGISPFTVADSSCPVEIQEHSNGDECELLALNGLELPSEISVLVGGGVGFYIQLIDPGIGNDQANVWLAVDHALMDTSLSIQIYAGEYAYLSITVHADTPPGDYPAYIRAVSHYPNLSSPHCKQNTFICTQEITLHILESESDSEEDADADGYTLSEGDCDDTDNLVHPGASDVGGDHADTIDNDCDGFIDEEQICLWYYDEDLDGYGNPDRYILYSFEECPEESPSPAIAPVTNSTDCNDADAEISPGVTEICQDSIDNNCDSLIDEEGCLFTEEGFDYDGDGYSEPNGDCKEGDAEVHPGANEICEDGVDNNCDGIVDPTDGTCTASGGGSVLTDCELLEAAGITDDSCSEVTAESAGGGCSLMPNNHSAPISRSLLIQWFLIFYLMTLLRDKYRTNRVET